LQLFFFLEVMNMGAGNTKENKKQNGGLDLTADELKGRQSVRATFRLPSQAIELLSIAANQLGLKQKSLFDQLVEDRSVLDQVANEAHDYTPTVKERRQKTFVLSRSSLDSLEHIASEHRMPRDMLVEVSIRRLVPVITAEQIKHEKRASLLKEMESFLVRGRNLLAKAEKMLGDKDPVFQKIASFTDSCERNVEEAKELVEKGKQMDRL
jgi:uncharacterized protein (UPF0147 family)